MKLRVNLIVCMATCRLKVSAHSNQSFMIKLTLQHLTKQNSLSLVCKNGAKLLRMLLLLCKQTLAQLIKQLRRTPRNLLQMKSTKLLNSSNCTFTTRKCRTWFMLISKQLKRDLIRVIRILKIR